MEVKTIILFVVIILLLIIVINYITKDVNTLSSLTDGKTMQKIEAEDLATSSSSGNTSNFTYSIWFFIDDWNYRYGEPKIIYGRMTTGSGKKEPCPSVTLGPIQNNVIVSLAVFPGLDEQPEDGSNFIVHNCGMGGISGWTSRFQYWPDATNPQKAWDIYKAGYGGSLLGSLFGKYTIKVSVMEGDTEKNSFEI